MKVKELLEKLQKMDPEAELTLYIGGEEWYHDFELSSIECYDIEFPTIYFILSKEEGWKIHQELQVEDFCHHCECSGYDISWLSYDEQLQLYTDVQDVLANDDCYNECYHHSLVQIVKDKAKEL